MAFRSIHIEIEIGEFVQERENERDTYPKSVTDKEKLFLLIVMGPTLITYHVV